MKIKTKKQMNLHELIQWAWDNGVRDKVFVGSEKGRVRFNEFSWCVILNAVEPDETFTVEVEEEITEETKIPKLIETYKTLIGESSCCAYSNESINYVLESNKYFENLPPKCFYMLNDDMTMTLIWKDGEMVE